MEDENFEIKAPLSNHINAHTSLLIEILANQQTIIDFMLPGIAKNNDLSIEEIENKFKESVWEKKKFIGTKFYEDFGPDLDQLLKDK